MPADGVRKMEWIYEVHDFGPPPRVAPSVWRSAAKAEREVGRIVWQFPAAQPEVVKVKPEDSTVLITAGFAEDGGE